MANFIAEAQSAWPAIEVAADRFAAHLAERMPGNLELEEALRVTHIADLYLACACVDGNERALAAFECDYLTVVDRALPRLGVDGDMVNEIKQRLRRALLVADTGPPQVAKYSGRGALRSWVRVLAVREALTMMRSAGRHVVADEDRLLELVTTVTGPEIEYLKRLLCGARGYVEFVKRGFDDLAGSSRLLHITPTVVSAGIPRRSGEPHVGQVLREAHEASSAPSRPARAAPR